MRALESRKHQVWTSPMNRFINRIRRIERRTVEPGFCTHGLAPSRPSILAFVEGADLEDEDDAPAICPLCNRVMRRRPSLRPSDVWPPKQV
jgi:hypothetical protein